MIRIVPTRLQLLELLPKGSVCAEVGVYKGDMSQAIMRVVHPAKLHLVDMWERWYAPEYQEQLDPLCLHGPSPADTQGDGPLTADQWKTVHEQLETIFVGQPVKFHIGVSWQVAHQFEDNSLDWVYLDGDHRREGCLADLLSYEPKVKPGGYLLGHDFSFAFPGVIQAVMEFIQGGKAQMVAIDRSEFTSYMLRKPLS